MSILICSTKYGGCGYVGKSEDWPRVDPDGDFLPCPCCNEDHTFGLCEENFERLTDDRNRDRARELLDKEEKRIKKFELRWNDGKTEIVEGNDIADACRRAGIGAGALPALNYWRPLDENTSIGIGISMVTTEVSSSKCPGCGKSLDLATSFKGEEPEAGTASICSECGSIAIFGENLELRKPTEAELEEIKKEPAVQQLLALMENVKRFEEEKGEEG